MSSHTPSDRRTSRFLPVLLLMIFAAILIWRFFPNAPWDGRDPKATAPAITPRGDLAEDEKSTIAIFSKAAPSVVHITTLAVRQSAFSLDLLQIPRGTGTGFLWDDQGHVVTNYHVIQGADAARVTLNDQSTWQGRLVGAYPDRDLAVLMIDAPKSKLRALDV